MSQGLPFELQLSGATRFGTARAVSEVSGRPQRSLLAMLAMRVGDRLSADQLIEWTWGSDLPDNPLGALQTRLSRLRSDLGDHRDVVVSAGDSYVLDVEPRAIDLVRYENAVQDHDNNLERLVEVDSWWRGTPFADAEPLDVLLSERQRLELLWVAGRGDIVDLLAERGQYEEAYAWCEHTLKQQPFDERIMASQLDFAARLHLGKGFVSRFETWKERYREVFGDDPPSELDDLAARITGRVTTRERVEPSEPAAETDDYDRVLDIAVQTPLFGAQAKQLLADDAPTMLVLGGYGFGKTLLAAAWRRRRMDAGTLVFAGSGQSLSQLIVTLRRSVELNPPSTSSSMAVVVDDLHLATDAELNEFRQFWRRHGSEIRFMVTSRPPIPGGVAQQVLAAMSMGHRATVVTLAPVDQASVEELVAENLPAEGDSELIERMSAGLGRMTGGHPAALDLTSRGVLSHASPDVTRASDLELAPVVAGLFASEFQNASTQAQRVIAIVAATSRRVPTSELADLIKQLDDEHGATPEVDESLQASVTSAQSSGLVSVNAGRLGACGELALNTVGQYAPGLMGAATTVMTRRARARNDVFDLAVQQLANAGVGAGDALKAVLDAIGELEALGQRKELLDLADRVVERGILDDYVDAEMVRLVAQIHLGIGLAAEQEALTDRTDFHLEAAIQLAVRHDLEDVVTQTGAGWGHRDNPHRTTPAGDRHALAVAWAKRRGSSEAQLRLEIESLRHLRRRGLSVPPSRLERVEDQLPDSAPDVQAQGWGLIAEVLMSYPLSEMGDRIEHALANAEANVAAMSADRVHYDDPGLILQIVRGAYATRRRDVVTAEDAIQQALGLAHYRNHRVYYWYALSQTATVEALRCSDSGWYRAVMKTITWGRKYDVFYERNLEWHFTLAAKHFGLPAPDVDSFDPHHFREIVGSNANGMLALLASFGVDDDREHVVALWRDLADRGASLMTMSSTVFAARCAMRLEIEELYGEILERLEPYRGEFVVLPNAACPVGDVDLEIDALRERLG